MSADYAPGTVAVATVRGVPNTRVFRSGKGWQGVQSWLGDSSVTDVRPLVMLDLDLAAHIGVGALVADLRTSGFYDLADQIEAQTRPPKPDEPTGLGAVVEDASGKRFVRYDGDWPWLDGTASVKWQHITAVRVLSEGVTA